MDCKFIQNFVFRSQPLDLPIYLYILDNIQIKFRQNLAVFKGI
jgi:hypothetical protein